jgi:hypothetical protein
MNTRVTRLVKTYAEKEQAALDMHVPSICASSKRWVANGYRKVHIDTGSSATSEALGERFSSESQALGYGGSRPEAVIFRVVESYEDQGTHVVVLRAEQLERVLRATEVKEADRALTQLEHDLGNPKHNGVTP